MMPRLQRQLCGVLRSILAGKKVPIPEAGRELMAIFFQLSEARTWHANGPNPIGFTDIEAWIRLARVPLGPHHVALIRALDSAWVEDFYRRRATMQDMREQGRKILPPVSAHPLTAALFDVTAG